VNVIKKNIDRQFVQTPCRMHNKKTNDFKLEVQKLNKPIQKQQKQTFNFQDQLIEVAKFAIKTKHDHIKQDIKRVKTPND